MMQLSARLQEAGFPHAVPLKPSVTPRLAYRWLHRHLPEAMASVIPYVEAQDEFGVGFVVGFQDRRLAEVFERSQEVGLAV